MTMATLIEPFGGGLSCDDPVRNAFDIHGGGIDLVFPHHENEIAQSCCAFGSTRMANYWMHNGFLQVESEKMSKSLGNFVTIRELLETGNFGNRTWPGEALRLAMLRTHYRQPINWTVTELERAQRDLTDWYDVIRNEAPSERSVDDEIIGALSDDLNTHGAIMRVHELAKAKESASLRASLNFLGFSTDPTQLSQRVFTAGRAQGTAEVAGAGGVSAQLRVTEAPDRVVFELKADGIHTDESTLKRIAELIAARKVARAARDFAEADKLRDRLAQLGVAIQDNKDGTTTWEPQR
jgi:cysteinyl-tRNA synthetase